MNSDIYVRAHTVAQQNKEKHENKRNSDWPNNALVFDCESRITADQTLTFGFWRFCRLRNGVYSSVEEGVFHDQELSAKELHALRKYARTTNPETTDDGCDRLRLYSRSKFIEEIGRAHV